MAAPTARSTSPRWPAKFLATVSARQIKVIASDATPDRMGDILEPSGCVLANYKRNPIVLAQHNYEAPIGRCVTIAVEGGAVVATIEFPPEGTSALADEYARLAKGGVLSAVSVGFLPLARKPLDGGGWRYTAWEMLELSIVSVPANPSALVTERGFAGRRAPDSVAAHLRRARAWKDRIEGREGALPVPTWTPRPTPTEIEARAEAERRERAASALRVAAALQW